MRLYGFGLRWPGPTLQCSRVVAQWLGIVQGVEWFLGLGIHSHGIAGAPFLGCGFPPLFPGRVDTVGQGVAWFHGSSHGCGAQREGCPCTTRVRGFIGI